MIGLRGSMKKWIIYLTIICAVLLFASPVNASSDEIPPLAPDRAQLALNLMAINCQNLSDLGYSITDGQSAYFESMKQTIAVTQVNINYLIRDFASDLVSQFNDVFYNLEPTSESALAAANSCQNLRYQIYQRMANTPGVLQLTNPVTDYESCLNGGFFESGGTCFMNGNVVFDTSGYIIGLYNADCFTRTDAYYGTCWYCEYGNTQSECNDYPY